MSSLLREHEVQEKSAIETSRAWTGKGNDTGVNSHPSDSYWCEIWYLCHVNKFRATGGDCNAFVPVSCDHSKIHYTGLLREIFKTSMRVQAHFIALGN